MHGAVAASLQPLMFALHTPSFEQRPTPSRPPHPHPLPCRILNQVATGNEKGLQAEVLKRDFSREVGGLQAKTGAGA